MYGIFCGTQCKRSHGFTILELLVVVAIIGILASLGFALFNKPKIDSRDARREADMKQIQNALALYISSIGTYPICTTPEAINGTTDCLSAALVAERTMPQVPTDPLGVGVCPSVPPVAPGMGYCYVSNDIGNDYAIYYHPEASTKSSGTIEAGGWYRINP